MSVESESDDHDVTSHANKSMSSHTVTEKSQESVDEIKPKI